MYRDENSIHDHTYIGNGCASYDGETAPCDTRIVEEGDNTEQKNGTYYNEQAATSGTGGGMTTDNTNSPDTFCPLGWQLPYSGTGGDYYDQSKSWYYLFTTYGIGFNDGTSTDTAKIKSYPFSYVYSGGYYWNLGKLYYQSLNGLYWSSTMIDKTNSYFMITWPSAIRPTRTGNRAAGLAVRCFCEINILTYVDN